MVQNSEEGYLCLHLGDFSWREAYELWFKTGESLYPNVGNFSWWEVGVFFVVHLDALTMTLQ